MPIPFTKEQLDQMSIEEVQALRDQYAQKVSTRSAERQNVLKRISGGPLAKQLKMIVIKKKLDQMLTPKTAQEQLAEMELEAAQERRRQSERQQMPTSIQEQEPEIVQDQSTDITQKPYIEVSEPDYDRFGSMVYKKKLKENPEYLKPADRIKVKEDEEQQKLVKENVVTAAQDMLKTISEVEKGKENFGVFGNVPSFPGTKRKVWESNTNKLLASQILGLMSELKKVSKTGATGFGALNEKELAVLTNASTALKKDVPSEYAESILKDLKEIAQKRIGSTLFKAGDTEVIDGVTYKRNESGQWTQQ